MGRPVVALAGGVGAARFLEGLVQVVPPDQVTAIVNTGDDRDFFGLRVCPDLDIVTYTLAGMVNRETGWGFKGETFHCLEALGRLRSDTWFALGDRDLATHVQRTARLREGASLTQVCAELATAFGVEVEILPMTHTAAPTRIVAADGSVTDFQEYLVRDGAPSELREVDLRAAAAAQPTPQVLDALDGAETVLICPSNPVVSIGTILAVPGVRERLQTRRRAVGVSPIIGGRPVKGPADRLLPAIGAEVSALGVARLYRDVASGFVIDHADASLAPEIEALGLAVRVEDTLMKDAKIAANLAAAVLELAESAP